MSTIDFLLFILHSTENLKHVFPKSQQCNLASKSQIRYPKPKFYNSMWSVFPMRPKSRVLALSASFPNYYVLYSSSWNCQMLSADQLLPSLAAWVALPSVRHGKNQTYWATILQLSWSGRQSRSTLQLFASFVCPPSPPVQVYCTQPPLRHTEHMTSKSECDFLPFYCSMHTCNLTHPVLLIWYQQFHPQKFLNVCR